MISRRVAQLPHGIACIDTGLFRPNLAACYLIRHRGRAGIVETGASNSVPFILNALRFCDVDPGDVLYVMPTHVHLDHAGGAGAPLQHLPQAKLVVHPRGSRHLTDPSRLWTGSAEVYGEEMLERIYGPVVPVPEERIIEAPDGLALDLNGRRLLFIDTPGHARHHYSIWDETSGGFFTGDTFGISYRELDSARGAMIFPTTTPVQFDPDAWLRTIDRYLEFGPQRMFLTHFSMVGEVPRLADDLRDGIRFHAQTARDFARVPDRHERIKAGLGKWMLEHLRRLECPLPEAAARGLLEMDLELNTLGLIAWLDSMAKRADGAPAPDSAIR
jgi:glyoxylase-like metal-dependent hydrolase (beta-lactamase superfamily II)